MKRIGRLVSVMNNETSSLAESATIPKRFRRNLMISKYLKLNQIEQGDSLYQYTKGESLMNILRTKSLFATKSSFLNDTRYGE